MCGLAEICPNRRGRDHDRCQADRRPICCYEERLSIQQPYPGLSSAMTFSRWQWIAIFVLDLLVKAIYFFVTTLHLLTLIFAVFLSLFHFIALLAARVPLRMFSLSHLWNTVAMLALTNILFAALTYVLLLWSIRSRRMTACSGIENICTYVDGTITYAGVLDISTRTAVYILLNLATFLIAFALRIRGARRANSWSANSSKVQSQWIS